MARLPRLAALAWALVALAMSADPASAGVLVFSSDRCPPGGGTSCGESLWTVSDAGANLTQITPGAGEGRAASFDSHPSWSPDGRSVLYRRSGVNADHPWKVGLWVMALDGSGQRRVGPEAPNALFEMYDTPEWSPDGRWIAFSGRPADAPRLQPGHAIWLMSSDGSVIRRLTDGAAVDSDPQFSPDGRRLAFTRMGSEREGREPQLLTVDLDGSDPAPVIVGAPPGAVPPPPGGDLIGFTASWSPDGKLFAVGYVHDVYTVAADGSDLRWRGRTEEGIYQLEWTLEPTPALILAVPMRQMPLYRWELTAPGLAPKPLTPPVTNPEQWRYYGGDQDPDWRPSEALPPRPDVTPPIALPVDTRPGARLAALQSRRRVITVRRRRLGILALDPSGVRRVDAAIGRRVRTSGARARCRFVARRRLSRPRSCRRPIWRRVRSARDFRAVVRRLRPGRYVLRLRARDALGNRSARPRRTEVRLRR